MPQNKSTNKHEIALTIPLQPGVDPLVNTAGAALAEIFGEAVASLGLAGFAQKDADTEVTPVVIIHCEVAELTDLQLTRAYMVAQFVRDRLEKGVVALLIDDDTLIF